VDFLAGWLAEAGIRKTMAPPRNSRAKMRNAEKLMINSERGICAFFAIWKALRTHLDIESAIEIPNMAEKTARRQRVKTQIMAQRK